MEDLYAQYEKITIQREMPSVPIMRCDCVSHKVAPRLDFVDEKGLGYCARQIDHEEEEISNS